MSAKVILFRIVSRTMKTPEPSLALRSLGLHRDLPRGARPDVASHGDAPTLSRLILQSLEHANNAIPRRPLLSRQFRDRKSPPMKETVARQERKQRQLARAPEAGAERSEADGGD